ncbi:MAG: AMP-binding protein, partial [Solirubrobacterales bacterium]|nr:AMP-binding protein [Solirubrobacterales bacterium]
MSAARDPKGVIGDAVRLAGRAGDEAYFAALCIRSGLIGPEPPHRVPLLVRGFRRYGLLGGAVVAGGLRHGDRPVMIDERGAVSYKELDERTDALANAWRDHGLTAGEGVAILARNHRGFFEAVFAAAKCGARIVLLNTSFAGPQIREVATREGTDLLVYDDEYSDTLKGIEDPPRGRFRAWADEPGDDTLDALIDGGDSSRPPKPEEWPKITILTSGTTGTPKGAPRSEPRSLSLIGGLLSKVPFRARETTEVCVPMFHAFGFMEAMVGVALGSTLVVRRRFDPEQTLESLEEHRATATVMVPVMLSRFLDLGEEKIKAHDLSSLRIVFVSGSALGADLAERATKVLGPVVYNLYGSTEIAYATIACMNPSAWNIGTHSSVISCARNGTLLSRPPISDRERGSERGAPLGVPVVPLVRIVIFGHSSGLGGPLVSPPSIRASSVSSPGSSAHARNRPRGG